LLAAVFDATVAESSRVLSVLFKTHSGCSTHDKDQRRQRDHSEDFIGLNVAVLEGGTQERSLPHKPESMRKVCLLSQKRRISYLGRDSTNHCFTCAGLLLH
jgi:hypothetical protein